MLTWEKPGADNTAATAELAIQRAQELKIKYLVVASNSGFALRHYYDQDFTLVGVTHHVGFTGPGIDEAGDEVRLEWATKGIRVLTTTHLLAGLDRGVMNAFQGAYPTQIVAQTLRMFGQGVKVAIEIAVMALDAGLIPYGEDVIAVGGTVEGSDSAIVIRPAHSNYFFKTQIREIICMPRVKG
ncbi:MAG: pyruvate kinase alpha/beta domain-containing protein [Methylocystaceae bacterium]